MFTHMLKVSKNVYFYILYKSLKCGNNLNVYQGEWINNCGSPINVIQVSENNEPEEDRKNIDKFQLYFELKRESRRRIH